MNKILIVAATNLEIEAIEKELIAASCDILITGIGTNSSTYFLTKYLQYNSPSLILNIGIAGSFSSNLAIGQVVRVATDQFTDLGIETQNEFLPLHTTNLPNSLQQITRNGVLSLSNHCHLTHLKSVNAITSDTAHGNILSITKYVKQFSPEIETMEGAAIAMTALLEDKQIIALKAISNYVEPRDLSKWNIPLALENLHKEVLLFVSKINTPS